MLNYLRVVWVKIDNVSTLARYLHQDDEKLIAELLYPNLYYANLSVLATMQC